jgi:acetyl-CoA carboxylase carboxyltransferase component
LEQVLEAFAARDDPDHTNVLKIFLKWNSSENPKDQELLKDLQQILKSKKDKLHKFDVKRVTVVVDNLKGQIPFYFTFRQRFDYDEDPMYRHIEPTLAFQLFLRKMSNYDIQPVPYKDPSVHVYFGSKRKKLGVTRYDFLNKRYFIRTLVLSGDIFTHENPEEFQISEAERYLVASLNALELAMADSRYPPTYANHIYINILPEIVGKPDMVTEIISRFQNTYASRLWNLRVTEVEVKLNVKTSPTASVMPLRFVATNKTGYNLMVDIYQEVKDQITGKLKYSAFLGKQNVFHGQDINTPHPLLNAEHQKRRIAHNNDTSYVYDYPDLFERGLKHIWKHYLEERNLNPRISTPKNFFVATELILNSKNELVPTSSDKIGENKCGMIVWRMTMKTPEVPEGRDVIVIANDITFQSGSFGPIEDEVFQKASELSRKEKIPRLYIAANSGARIGLATEVQEVFKVQWIDADEPSKGFKYLYVTEKDYQELSKTKSINAVEIEEQGEKRWKIIDVIGKEHGLGVENLRGSGMIAGETSRAYNEVFTLNYVAARSVGIGAYLNRLGQRVIQNRKAPILLTGASALNKVLSKEVYSSNLQLGGTQIMYPNGVSHLVSNDDMTAIHQILTWLSYVPKFAGGPLPSITPIDPVAREVACVPTIDVPCDIRSMLAGELIENPTDSTKKIWKGGLLDKDTFFETLGGWAKNIVVARGRLGGIPMGVLAVDTKTVEQVIPADPADPASRERVVLKSGQVWFPDSAFKTAQAIKDFNNGEELPLLVLANWRGFSGGQRDMYDEILKFGSYIVDALVNYKKPVFVYIVPFGELRGGAWVVIDPMINPEMMEMYADEQCRGGVLEPSGIVEIKFRKQEIIDTIHRLDKKYIELAKDLGRHDIDNTQKEDIMKQMTKREQQLIPIYTHIAIQFADLHDTPGRMKTKGVVSDTVSWPQARKFFFWRLKRKLAEFELYGKITQANKTIVHRDKVTMLQDWIRKSQVDTSDENFNSIWADDQRVLAWIDEHRHEIENHHLKSIRQQQVTTNVLQLCQDDPETVINTLLEFLKTCEPNQQLQLQKHIKNQMFFNF